MSNSRVSRGVQLLRFNLVFPQIRSILPFKLPKSRGRPLIAINPQNLLAAPFNSGMKVPIQERFGFRTNILGLPPEVRLKIYRLLHIHSRTIGDCRDRRGLGQHWQWEQFSMDWHGPGTSFWDRFHPQKPSCQYRDDPGSSTCSLSGQLLATCRLIHNESSDILYGENTFGLSIYIRESFFDACPQNFKIEKSFFEGFQIDDLDLPWPAKKLHPRGTETRRQHKVRYQFAVNKIRRLRLVLNLDSLSSQASHIEYNHLKHLLHSVCRRLQGLHLYSTL